MTNFERCATSRQQLATTIKNMSQIGPEVIALIDWDSWMESDSDEPKFKKAMPGRYTPTRNGSRWYRCLILDDEQTLFGRPAALIWTLAADHVAIVVLKEYIRYE